MLTKRYNGTPKLKTSLMVNLLTWLDKKMPPKAYTQLKALHLIGKIGKLVESESVTSDLSFRLSIRQKSANNKPHTNILFQKRALGQLVMKHLSVSYDGNAFQFGNYAALKRL